MRSIRSVYKCIFCEQQLQPPFSAEHILLDAFGGKKTTRTSICPACNNSFGRTIDNDLAKQTIDIRNMFKMGRGSDGSAPTLNRVSIGNKIVNIKGDGTLELANQKPFEIEHKPDGQVSITFTGSDVETIRKYLPHAARKLGISEDYLRDKMLSATATESWERPGVRNLALSFDGEVVLRAAVKAFLILWSTVVGNEELRRTPYEAARSYVIMGCKYFTERFTNLDARPLPTNHDMIGSFGPLYNSIIVSSDKSGKVIEHYTLNNVIGIQSIIAFDGGAPNKTAFLANDPLMPSNWSTEQRQEFNVSFDWLEKPEYYDNLESARMRIARMMALYEPLMMPSVLESIIDQVCKKYGYSGHSEIDPEQVDLIKSEAWRRFELHRQSQPYTEKLSAEKLKELFGRKA